MTITRTHSVETMWPGTLVADMPLRWLYIVLITLVLLLATDLTILHTTDWYQPTPSHTIIHTPAYRGSIEL